MALYSFSSIGLLCFATSLMVAVVNGTSPFYGRPLASVAGAESRGDSIFNRYYAENAAARSMQTESCPVSGAHEVCHTANLESDLQIHICPTDGSPCDQNVCYYSSRPVMPCTCLDAIAGIRLECKSVTTLLVEGRTFNVTHYQTPLADNEVCVSISPAVEICDEDCGRLSCIDCPQNVECDSNGANCQCREGFSDSEESGCCDCEDGYYENGTRCIKFCRENCRTRATGLDENRRPIAIGGCTTCFNDYAPPTCCNCSSGLVEVDDGICKCIVNTFPNGSCIAGAQPQNCCLCATGYQKNPDTGKCELEKCAKNQTLYFYVDATNSNTFDNFCPLIAVMQMLVAAFNPSSTSGTKINALLFPDIPRSKDPSHVFNTSATCLEAIHGQNGFRGLSLLLSEFGVCRDKGGNYFSADFPSSCGEGTSAVKGLEEIYDMARTSSGSSSGESAVLMLTDGVIMDDSKSRTTVLQNLSSAGVSTLIAAGIDNGTNPANRGNLRNYTSDDNIVIKKDPIELGIAIVRKLEERKIICKDHADNITASLKGAQGNQETVIGGGEVPTLRLFCRCHRKEQNDNCDMRTIKYPTCGGDVSIGVPLKNTPTQEQELDSLILEEEILAAVESVLERFEG